MGRMRFCRVMNGWMSWTQTEEENEAEDWSQRFHTVSLTKYKSRAGFVIWSRRYRWDFFCQQGFKAATGKLTQMLKSLGPLAATRVPASDQPGSQMTEETQDLMSETQSLVTAMYSQFKSQLNHLGIPGFKTFEDLVLALDLQWLYINIVEATLSDVCLNMSTVHLLMSASRHVGWGKLECGLGKVITNTFCSYGLVCRDTKLVEAAEAASFLEIQDATVRPPLAVLVSILAHLARCTSHLASSGAFFNGNDVEEVSDILVDAYLQNPQYYYATEVLGPACLQVTEGQDFLGSLTESPAFVKLLAGCLYQLQRPLQLDPVRNMHKKCACADCQLVQSFLAQTEQATMLVQYSKEHAHHVMQQLQHQADFQGHMWMARQKSSSTLICSKEAPTEKLLRLQQARSLLPRVQAVFNQAVVTLFLKSGQPPAEQCAVVQQEEDEHEPKPKTKPVAVRYNLW